MKLKKEELVVERATVMMDVVQLQTQKQISNEGRLIMLSCPPLPSTTPTTTKYIYVCRGPDHLGKTKDWRNNSYAHPDVSYESQMLTPRHNLGLLHRHLHHPYLQASGPIGLRSSLPRRK